MKTDALVIGGGPAGLMAAERLALSGHSVLVVEQMPSFGRKFLMAGRGGLNLTHSEPIERFRRRYGKQSTSIAGQLKEFSPEVLRAWADELGAETFVGSSGRVFPKAMKTSPLLRAWLRRLSEQGVDLRSRWRWLGEAWRFETPEGDVTVAPQAVVLALGGASWPKLGATGAWLRNIPDAMTTAFAPSNAGVRIAWSEFLLEKFAGQALKNVSLSIAGARQRGDLIISRDGLIGGAVYALNPMVRKGADKLIIDLLPDRSADDLAKVLTKQSPKASMATRLGRLGLDPIKRALLFEQGKPADILHQIKALTFSIEGLMDLERAISSVGGLHLDTVDEQMMLRDWPGVFAAGEMLDWDAPTGGYLLQACFAQGFVAGAGACAYLKTSNAAPLAPSLP